MAVSLISLTCFVEVFVSFPSFWCMLLRCNLQSWVLSSGLLVLSGNTLLIFAYYYYHDGHHHHHHFVFLFFCKTKDGTFPGLSKCEHHRKTISRNDRYNCLLQLLQKLREVEFGEGVCMTFWMSKSIRINLEAVVHKCSSK